MDVLNTQLKIGEELIKAEGKFPWWPIDIIHGVAIIQEEVGELVKACLDFYYGRGNREQILKEATQAGAMIYRFMCHYEEYLPFESDEEESHLEERQREEDEFSRKRWRGKEEVKKNE